MPRCNGNRWRKKVLHPSTVSFSSRPFVFLCFLFNHFFLFLHFHALNTHQLTGEVNNTDYLFITAPTNEHFVLTVDMLEAGKMGKRKDLRV